MILFGQSIVQINNFYNYNFNFTNTIFKFFYHLKGILRPPKKTKPSDFSTRVPPYANRDILMVLSEISPWRARCSNWFLEYLRAHCHVLVLPDSSSWPAIQEILVVEEIYDLDPAGKYLHQTTHRRFLPNAIPTLTVFSSLR